jgi:hypothetical protein
MSIKIGDKIRHAVTHEEGAVVAISNNTPTCVEVQGIQPEWPAAYP